MLGESIAGIESAASREARLTAVQQLLGVLGGGKRERPERLDPSQLPHRATDKQPPEPRVLADPPRAEPVRVAAAGGAGFLLAQANPDVPTDADKQQTLEVQCTDEINALAASLEHDPVRMYEHVRNNYDFQPTWGSIKGAQAAYFSASANAHDLASLLIALYRCSDIPARYVHGTVDVPIERFVKWAGIENPAQASSLFSSGGIPATLVSVNDVIEKVRMEHVWVKAYVDYTPSRGGVFMQGDRWIELDPSFKEHDLVKPVDLRTALSVDGQGLLDALAASGSVNGDSVTGIDPAVTEAARQSVKDQILGLLAGNNLAVMDELLGQQQRIEKKYGILPITTVVDVITRLGEYVEIPAAQRYSIRVTLEDLEDDDGFTSTSFDHSVAMPGVAAQRFTLSYAPADDATRTYLQSLLPAGPGPGRTLEDQIAEMPHTLNAASVSVLPQLRIAGTTVASGVSRRLGSDQFLRIRISSPNGFANADFTNNVSAGVAQAISLNLGAYRKAFMDQRKAALAAIKDLLENPPADLADLNVPKDEWAGEYLWMGGLTYWALIDTFNSLAQRLNDTTATRLPSVGLFSYDLSIVFSGFFGVFEPDSATIGGFGTDIDHDLQAVVSNHGADGDSIAYMLSSGVMGSYLEGSIWDLITSNMGDETNDLTGRGVSTAHVLSFANANNIPVYVIDSSNWSVVSPQLNLPSGVMSAIAGAVAQGKMVTVPQTSVTLDTGGAGGSGWTGVGYAVTDKATGAGAYLIDGGRAGGGFDLPNLDPSVVLILGFLLLAVGVLFPALAVAAAIAAIVLALYDFASSAQDIYNNDNLTGDQQDMLAGLLGLFAVIGIIFAIIGLTSLGTAVPFLAVALAILFYAFMVALIVGALADLMANINRRNNMLPWFRRRFEWQWETQLAQVDDDLYLPGRPGGLMPA